MMKEKILLLLCLVLSIVVFLIRDSKVYASSNDAACFGYEISNQWIYVSDVDFDETKVETSKYYYGSMNGWAGAYKYYDEKENEMFVLLLCTGWLQSSQKSYWDQRRWNNKEMSFKFYSNETNVQLMNYSPKTTEGEISITDSISINTGVNGNVATLGYSVSSSSSYTISEIPVCVRENTSSVLISHNFLKYKSNTSLSSVCCQSIRRNNLALFKIEDYSPTKNYQFSVILECAFYRNGVFNSSSLSDKFMQTFVINSKN